ncbi:GNAT family N-acetyltransferase [Metabacillus sp. RGM 3146]|uniref:GNAT family N-acetyltransferase n=1 Tax=Metabacillus sp. RGM 3146 TaxID=3401092 RepID=UPI003B9B2BBD
MIMLLDITDCQTAETVLNVQIPSYHVEAGYIGSAEIPPLKDTAASLMNCGETFLGYFLEEELAGFLSYEVEGDEMIICRVAVHPSFFKKGIAQGLMLEAEKAERGINKWKVSTGTLNKPAINLYLKMGFVKTKDVMVQPDLWITCLEKQQQISRSGLGFVKGQKGRG